MVPESKVHQKNYPENIYRKGAGKLCYGGGQSDWSEILGPTAGGKNNMEEMRVIWVCGSGIACPSCKKT